MRNRIGMLGALAGLVAVDPLTGRYRGRRRRRRSRNREDHRAASRLKLHARLERGAKRLEAWRKAGKAGEPLRPVHPRERYWFAAGVKGEPFTLEIPTHGGGSYYWRYRAMHEAGAKAREEGDS